MHNAHTASKIIDQVMRCATTALCPVGIEFKSQVLGTRVRQQNVEANVIAVAAKLEVMMMKAQLDAPLTIPLAQLLKLFCKSQQSSLKNFSFV